MKVKVINPETGEVVEVHHPSRESMRWKRAVAAEAEAHEEAAASKKSSPAKDKGESEKSDVSDEKSESKKPDKVKG